MLRGLAVLINLVYVPALLGYLNADKYGVWLTIISIVSWVQFFDLGVGNGLKIKFAEALALDDHARGKKLVSTAYFYLGAILLSLNLVLLPVVWILDWNAILNTSLIERHELVLVVAIVLSTFITKFLLSLISTILQATQRSAIAEIPLTVSNIISLGLIYIIKMFTSDSLLLVSLAITVPQVLLLLTANLFFFRKLFKPYSPSWKSIDKSEFRSIFNLGARFFFIQLAMLLLFSSTNIILTQVVGPQEVTVYNIAYKYFQVPMMAFTIIVFPFWSAFTEAYTKNETGWIKNSMKRLNLISLAFSGGTLLMLALSGFAYKFWIGDEVKIPFQLSLVFAIYNIFSILITPYSNFISSVGKLKFWMYFVSGKIILFLPLALLLTYHLHATGLVLALIIVNSLPSTILEPLQYKKIINHSKQWIWNK